jgi:hypothetical protein
MYCEGTVLTQAPPQASSCRRSSALTLDQVTAVQHLSLRDAARSLSVGTTSVRNSSHSPLGC